MFAVRTWHVRCCRCAAVPLRILAVAVLALGACNAGHFGGPGPQRVARDRYPSLLLPSKRSFCDQRRSAAARSRATSAFLTPSGEPLPRRSTGWCPQDCSNSASVPLDSADPVRRPPTGVAVTKVEGTWDGSYVECVDCGDGIACIQRHVRAAGALRGGHVRDPGDAHGDGCTADGGAPTPTCTATGPQECVEVPFNIPGPSPTSGGATPPPEGG